MSTETSPPTAAATATAPTVPPVTIEVKVRLQAIAILEADGRYSVAVPALPGCTTCGDTIEDAQANVIEAAEGWLAVGHDQEKAEAIRKMVE
jgi:predicted RNase H-like HicB family nuclease